MNFKLFKKIECAIFYNWVLRDNISKYDSLTDDITHFTDQNQAVLKMKDGIVRADAYICVAEFNELEELPNLLPEEFI